MIDIATKKASGLAINRRSLYDPVAEHLREMIIKGELTPGARVPVTELAADFGVSQTPMREALKVLAEEQLVELLPNRGARVLPYTAREAADLFQVIASLESLAAEIATTRLSKADLDALEEMHERMRGHYESGDKEPYFDINSRIHDRIMRLSGNEALIATHGKLIVRATRGRYMAIVDPERWAEAMDEHEQLMTALRDRDAAAAAAIWRLHLRHTGDSVCAILAGA
ncbi:HTH-type transcriptional regulator McbR [Hartmannibacter diazotrophicus]|uniref:HTH-type transcriptional regulator McbR n=1 Tax=Hartmannibacter diazotrophicus TaxID=1482074 RepID=A0A2C9D489_9HYPH|nr:GntR family transcriptional regulator [Hartmannibacter diazotrophicus]SON55030.1 HTH-type transcriptional regulator McbR [Hartmannibacter diazotrophicus]